jgi:hypothetical protein
VKLAGRLLTASPPLGASISSLYKTALNFAIYGRTRPGKMAVSTAVSPRKRFGMRPSESDHLKRSPTI